MAANSKKKNIVGIKFAHIFLCLCADEADLAIVTGPSVLLEVLDEVWGVDAAAGVDGGAAAEARDQRLVLAHRVGRLRAKALAADRTGWRTLEKK